MNNPQEWLPRILAAYKRDDQYFGVVQLELAGVTKSLEFGVHQAGYKTLRQILQKRPFENLTVGQYEYYFVPSVRRLENPEMGEFAVRIEQGRNGKNFNFTGPRTLIANLQWFQQIKDFGEVAHLSEIDM